MKNTVPSTYVINDIKEDKKIVRTCYKKELIKTNQYWIRIKKVLKKKGDKLYVKWKLLNNSYISWIHKKDIV